jgi:hypothetical protein
MLARLLLLAAVLGLSAPMLAQTGHPAKGSWSGDFIAGDSEKSRVRLLIDALNGELSGTVNPGRNGVDMSTVELDAASWTLTIRAPMPDGELVLTGTLSNLGSWNNRKYIGTWSMGNEKGNFDFTLN